MRRRVVLLLLAAALIASCASSEPPMRMPTDQETQACAAQGGTIEPAYALNEYVCLLPQATNSSPH